MLTDTVKDSESSTDKVTREDEVVLEIVNLTHRLHNKATGERFTVYVNEPLIFNSGDFVGLLGPSGCGKTTLLTLLGLLRSPSDLSKVERFNLHVAKENDGPRQCVDVKELWKRRKATKIESLRRSEVGFALQSGELISSLTVGENISTPLRLNGWPQGEIDARVKDLLDRFDLFRGTGESSDDRSLFSTRINRLSGGEYQRVALARSIAHRPAVLFVDEPTSALNRELAFNALNTLKETQLQRQRPGITIMITHDETLASKFCNVLVRMAPRKGEPAGEVVAISREKAQ